MSPQPSSSTAPHQAAGTRRGPAFGLLVAVVGAVTATFIGAQLATVSALVIALLIGLGFGTFGRSLAQRAEPGLQIAATAVLRTGIVLLGLRLSLSGLAELGLTTVATVVATVAITFFGTRLAGKRIGLSPGLSVLMAAGSSICGVSAIAAVKETTDATDDEVAVAMSIVTACGTIGLFALPALSAAFGFTAHQEGIWFGAAIQDVAQVVAAGSLAGEDVLAVAVLVKLTRVAMLAPIIAGLSIGTAAGPSAVRSNEHWRFPLPWFVVGFLVMVAVRSSGLIPDAGIDAAKTVEKAALTIAMVGIGARVRLQAIRQLGPKPLLLGLSAWLLVTLVSLGALLATG